MNTTPPTDTDPFAASAAYYDLDLGEYAEDIELYRDLLDSLCGEEAPAAQRLAPSVLELGCGTGRVALALAADGTEVVGVDVSPAMLTVAEAARARARPPGAVTLAGGDMRSLHLDRQFAMVLIPLGGLEHMEDPGDVLAALETVRAHLAPGGIALVDVLPPHADDFTPGVRATVEHWTRALPDGTQVTKTVSAESDPAAGLRHVTFHYDAQPPDGPLRRTTDQFPLRIFTPAEIDFAARASGLRLSALWGDYAGRPLDESAERMVALLEHAPDGEAPA